MISGFNSDIVLDGVVYHIQTEDRGSPSAEIVTQVFRAGEVIFTRRTPYPSTTDPSDHASLLQGFVRSQHMKLLQFVRSGGLKRKDLLEKVRSGDHVQASGPSAEDAMGSISCNPTLKLGNVDSGFPLQETTRILVSGNLSADIVNPVPPGPRESLEIPDTDRARAFSPEYLQGEQCEIELLSTSVLISGEIQPLRFRLRSNRRQLPLQHAPIAVNVYGTTIRPLCYSGRSDADGLFSIDLIIPRHSTGSSWVEVVAQTVLGLKTLKLDVSCPAVGK